VYPPLAAQGQAKSKKEAKKLASEQLTIKLLDGEFIGLGLKKGGSIPTRPAAPPPQKMANVEEVKQ